MEADLGQLILLVRARRVLRVVALAAPFALIAWLLTIGIGTEVADEGSAAWTWLDEHGDRGFVVILAILALDLVLLALVRLAHGTGATAARLVPLLRPIPDASLGGGKRAGKAGPLLDVGSRSRRVRSRSSGIWLGVLVVVLGIITTVAASGVPSSYRGSHGDGGPIVTIGKDAEVTRSVTRNTRVGDTFMTIHDYYISSPSGEVLVEGETKPAQGTRLAITDHTGVRLAVHVGGHSWVTGLVVAIVAFLLGGTALFFLIRWAARWTPDERVEPLATTLTRLASHQQVSVRAVPRRHPNRAGPASRLSLGALARGDAEATALQLRRRATILTLALLIGLAVPGLIVAYS